MGGLAWAVLVVVLVVILGWWLTATPEGIEILDGVVGHGAWTPPGALVDVMQVA